MRKRTINDSANGITDGTITYPNEYCFAYNPNYVEIDLGADKTTARVEVATSNESYSVECALFRGYTKCYISKMLQLLFSDTYLSTRSVEVTINVYWVDELIDSITTIAIWGSMKMGDTFGAGTMLESATEDNHAKFRRELVWYKQFPFKVSLFCLSTSQSIMVSRDGGTAVDSGITPKKGIFEITIPTTDTAKREIVYSIPLLAETVKSTFTAIFDKTFTGTLYQYLDEEVVIHISEDKAGYYIRWIDQYGFLEYWLFSRNTLTEKNKLGDTEIELDDDIEGIYYPNITRNTHVTNTNTVKCAAVNLTEGQLAIVKTIIKSPHIDIFMGYNMENKEIWLPCNIVAGSYKISETDILQDFEIQFTLPDTAAQTL